MHNYLNTVGHIFDCVEFGRTSHILRDQTLSMHLITIKNNMHNYLNTIGQFFDYVEFGRTSHNLRDQTLSRHLITI